MVWGQDHRPRSGTESAFVSLFYSPVREEQQGGGRESWGFAGMQHHCRAV